MVIQRNKRSTSHYISRVVDLLGELKRPHSFLNVGSIAVAEYRTTLYACWEPRAQARFDKAAATQTYEKLLDIWKTADPDFIPAQEARKEFAALNALKN